MCRTPDASALVLKERLHADGNGNRLAIVRARDVLPADFFLKLIEQPPAIEGNGGNYVREEQRAIGQKELAEKMRQTELPITLAGEDGGQGAGGGRHDDDEKKKRDAALPSLRVLSTKPGRMGEPPPGVDIVNIMYKARVCISCVTATNAIEECKIPHANYAGLQQQINEDIVDLRAPVEAKSLPDLYELQKKIEKIIESGKRHLALIGAINDLLDSLPKEAFAIVKDARGQKARLEAEAEKKIGRIRDSQLYKFLNAISAKVTGAAFFITLVANGVAYWKQALTNAFGSTAGKIAEAVGWFLTAGGGAYWALQMLITGRQQKQIGRIEKKLEAEKNAADARREHELGFVLFATANNLLTAFQFHYPKEAYGKVLRGIDDASSAFHVDAGMVADHEPFGSDAQKELYAHKLVALAEKGVSLVPRAS